MKVLCFGSANLDHIYQVDHFTKPGETQSCIDYAVCCGGKGSNQAIALALSGTDTWFAGIIGNDGLRLKETLIEKGVCVDYLKCSDAHTGHAVIEVDRNGQNRIVLYGGTNKAITKEYVDEVLSHFSAGDVVVLQNEINLIPYIIDQCSERGMKVVFNAAPYDDTLRDFPIEKTTWLVVNETEGAGLSGSTDYSEIPLLLKKRYPKTDILFTMGKAGSRIVTEDEDIVTAALKVTTVDTTAAGDTFIGYFVRGLTDGLSLFDTARLATAASAISVTRKGAVDSIPAYDEVIGCAWTET